MKRPLDLSSPLRRPLAIGAALLVTVVAGAQEVSRATRAGEVRAGDALPAPLRAVHRHDRVPSEPGGYVDVWGPFAPWEVRVLQGQGTSRSGR
ncbi:MAG: hypothetical protein ISQ11_13990 [Planctomycetes bacterium]|nr:hypothetical protein [Planctomycetota bacterium]